LAQRVIFLVDMNAFFISCEMTRNPALIGRPSAVAGDPKKRTGIILAANYEARSYGVKTAMTLHQALKLCPGMLIVPPDHHFYEHKSRQIMRLLSDYTPVVEQNSIDEAWLDMTGTEKLFGKPAEAARKIMNEIKDRLGLWCSIGISENKFLAKMAAEMKKPLGITELWKEDVPAKLWPLPIKSMYGIGEKTASKLRGIGIQTIGCLAKSDRDKIISIMGKSGIKIHAHANGYDDSPCVPNLPGDMKSIGRSTTLPEDITDIKKAKVVLLELADKVGMAARKHGKKGSTVQISLKYSNFQTISRQMTIPQTSTTRDIYETGCKLLEQNWNPSKPVRLIGISLSDFDTDRPFHQISIFDNVITDARQQKLDHTMDKIRSKYGVNKIKRAQQIKNIDSTGKFKSAEH
jgi:DNA polymerase-4